MLQISFCSFREFEVFHHIGYCSMNKTGSSGIGEIHDTFCVLGMNTHFRRAFLFTWIWLVLNIFITTFSVIANRVSTIFSEKFRYFSFRFYYVSTTIFNPTSLKLHLKPRPRVILTLAAMQI